MFKPDETICVSHNEYSYHSIPLETVLREEIITLIPTEDSCTKRNLEWVVENFDRVESEDLTLVALNPIRGYRQDHNCTAYRNFLVEIDHGSLKGQLEYIQMLGMPYSAIVFSGNKSMHFLISLDEDLANEKEYRLYAEWLLKAVTMADPNTKNPSRSIRIPGGRRGPEQLQRLVEFKGKVTLAELSAWLMKHPEAMPKAREKRIRSDKPSIDRLTPWTKKHLRDGVIQDRKRTWFAVACDFAIAGFSEEDTIDILQDYFVEEHDLREKKFLRIVHDAFKYVDTNK